MDARDVAPPSQWRNGARIAQEIALDADDHVALRGRVDREIDERVERDIGNDVARSGGMETATSANDPGYGRLKRRQLPAA